MSLSHNVPKLSDPSLLKTGVAYVNGEWVGAKSGRTFEVFGKVLPWEWVGLGIGIGIGIGMNWS